MNSVLTPTLASQSRTLVAVNTHEFHNPLQQTRLVAGDVPLSPLRAAMLAQHLTGPTLRHPGASETISNVLDRPSSFRRAQ
jgi:hypothetical protein